jgi:isopenicillin-N epimerase
MQYKDLFLLRPDITFLNFGSFGASPKPIFEEYQRLQLELEKDPVEFIVNTGPALLKESRDALAKFIDCDSEDLIFVQNPTYAVNVVAKNFALKPGDEVLSTNIEYGACDRTWKFYCGEKEAKYVRQPITLPLTSKERFLEDFWKGASEKTKLIFISQITSPTGIILPVEEICIEAKKRGIPVYIDGAHVPAHIDLSIRKLDPDYYTGACHKWMMTSKGSSFLYVKKEHQLALNPLIVSWGYEAAYPSNSQFYDYHQFNGTRDFTAYLTIPASIEFMKQYNWKKVSEESKAMVLKWLPRLCAIAGSEPLAPLTSEFFGQMGSIPVRLGQANNPMELKRELREKYKIEIPVMPENDKVYLRFSVNGFTTEEDMKTLEAAMIELKQQGKI